MKIKGKYQGCSVRMGLSVRQEEQEEIDASGVDANHLRLIIDFLQREKNPTEERVLKSFIEIITDP